MNVAPFPTRLGSDDALFSHGYPSEPHEALNEAMKRLAPGMLHHFQLILLVQHPLLGALALQCTEKDH